MLILLLFVPKVKISTSERGVCTYKIQLAIRFLLKISESGRELFFLLSLLLPLASAVMVVSCRILL